MSYITRARARTVRQSAFIRTPSEAERVNRRRITGPFRGLDEFAVRFAPAGIAIEIRFGRRAAAVFLSPTERRSSRLRDCIARNQIKVSIAPQNGKRKGPARDPIFTRETSLFRRKLLVIGDTAGDIYSGQESISEFAAGISTFETVCGRG